MVVSTFQLSVFVLLPNTFYSYNKAYSLHCTKLPKEAYSSKMYKIPAKSSLLKNYFTYKTHKIKLED